MDHFWVVQWLGQDVHLNTVVMVWVGMAVTLLMSVVLLQGASIVPASRRQVFAEGIYGFVRTMTFPLSGASGDKFLFIVGSLFLFILVSNLLGQFPLRLIHLPHGELMAATGDLNTTAALAVVAILSCILLSLKSLGLGGFIKHHLEPTPLILPLHLLDYLTRPGSLMVRLYANVLVGEILSGLAIKAFPILLPLLVILMECGVGFLQSYIFAQLTAVYIGMMVAHGDHH